MIDVILKKGRDKSARDFHPWLFSGAIDSVGGRPQPGEIVRVLDDSKSFVAFGYYNLASQIRVRLLEWNEDHPVDETWWRERIAQAVQGRRTLAAGTDTDSYRLIFGEADFLPGLIVDKYADFLVVQSLTAGIEAVREVVIDALVEILKPVGIYEKSDAELRRLEKIEPHVGWIYGASGADVVAIRENGLLFNVSISGGQKTGFYFDQRDNRRIAAAYAEGLEVLDCFSYTGAFSVYALSRNAASVTLIDASDTSLAMARDNVALNNLKTASAAYVKGDAFTVLREYRDAGRTFDMVIIDPPKFAPSKTHLKKALKGYKEINMLAMSVVRPGGLMVTFSCSGVVTADTLKMVLLWASLDVGRQVQYLHTLSHGVDHPRLVSFPESEYLKGFVCRIR